MILSGGNGFGGDLINRTHGSSSHSSGSNSSNAGASVNGGGTSLGEAVDERGRRRIASSSAAVAGGGGDASERGGGGIGIGGGVRRSPAADGPDLDGGARLDSLEKDGLLNLDIADADLPGNGMHLGVGSGAAAAAAGSGSPGGGGGGEPWFWTSPEGFRHVLVTGVFLGLSYVIAMAVDDLGVLLEVVGATGSTTIAFILPGLLYLKVHPEPHPKRSLAALQLTVGLFIIPVALTFIALGDPPEGR